METTYVPASAGDLYEKMRTWSMLRGTIRYDMQQARLIWTVADDLKLEITLAEYEGTIYVFDSAEKKKQPLTHWHPEAEEIYQELLDINTGKIRFSYIKTLFGKVPVSIGAPTGKKKYCFHTLHHLGGAAE